ncbi:unnamed protein product, partial [Brachionus calyciflorus]
MTYDSFLSDIQPINDRKNYKLNKINKEINSTDEVQISNKLCGKHTINSSTSSLDKTKFKIQKKKIQQEKYEQTSTLQIFFTHLCYTILEVFGHLREFLRSYGFEKRKGALDNNTEDFAPLFNSYESFHTRNVYVRNRDCFNRPICSVPGPEIELLERKSDDYNWTFYQTGRKIKALNLGSYNYLGFAENNGPSSKYAIQGIKDSGVATCSSRIELGTLKCHLYLEELIAKFLRVEASLVTGMGFATNSLTIPAIIGNDCLILSDELNHVSLILGARL